jgi:protease-4
MATPESREAMQSIVGSLHTDFVEAIARGRGIEKTVVEEALEKAPLSPETAVAMGLITGVGWEDEVAAEVNKRFDEPDILEFSRWARVALRKSALESWGAASPTIAVVVLKGAIVDGSGTPGAATLPALPACEALDALVEESVAGVVLAIDSPGGSAVASDRIWRSVVRLARTKPVVAWMGSVAASGGYYIAAGATEIVALPTTITGSIGVVGGKLSLGEALSQQGVHVEHIAATSQATMMSAIYRFSQGQRNSFRASLERVYQTFLERVSAGRRRPVRDILPYAGGRVWTGRQAIERGLVDRLGGLQGSPSAAVERAASLAGISEWRTIEVIPSIPEGWLLGRLRRLIRGLVQSEARALIGTELPSDPVLTGLLQLKSGAWALWPYMLLWR